MKFVGFDLDNTVFNYEAALEQLKADRVELRDFNQKSKEDLKKSIISNFGEDYWTELQGYLYTEYLQYVEIDPIFFEILNFLNSRGCRSTIISHKTVFPFNGPKLNMRECALSHLQTFKIDSLLSDGIHFFETKSEKIAYINEITPDIFVDDLPEILLELAPSIQRIHYTSNEHRTNKSGKQAGSWNEILSLITEAI